MQQDFVQFVSEQFREPVDHVEQVIELYERKSIGTQKYKYDDETVLEVAPTFLRPRHIRTHAVINGGDAADFERVAGLKFKRVVIRSPMCMCANLIKLLTVHAVDGGQIDAVFIKPPYNLTDYGLKD